jgi:hypothetical protein
MNEMNDTAARADARRGCDRAEDLIAYLYGEAARADERDFRAHLGACSLCREELAAFGGVRESVALFREEAHAHARPLDLGGALRAGAATAETPATAQGAPGAPARRRSALAALREFFRLSPLWLQAGAAAAALVLCVLAALTLARAEVRWDENGFAFRTSGGGAEAAKGAAEGGDDPAVYTRAQVEALLAERVAGEVAAARTLWEAESKQTASAGDRSSVTANDDGPPQTKPKRVVEAAAKAPVAPPRRGTPPARHARRPELALEDDDDLPRLSDLLGGAYD